MTDRSLTRRALVCSALMLAAATAGRALVPTRRMADLRGHFDLDAMIPRRLGDWRADGRPAGGIVDPESRELVDRLYSQLVDRVYIDRAGHRVMLLVAYGVDQADDRLQLHYPEVCYPAQGFRITANRRDRIDVRGGTLRVRRLETRYAQTLYQPVTYWTIVGDEQSLGGWGRKKSEILHGLKGEIVDGMLVRVSSVDRDTAQAFHVQDDFIRSLVAGLSGVGRRDIAGLGG